MGVIPSSNTTCLTCNFLSQLSKINSKKTIDESEIICYNEYILKRGKQLKGDATT